MGAMPKDSITALRTAIPLVDKAAPAKPRRTAQGGAPRLGRNLAFAVLAATVLGLAGFLSWSRFLSPVTVSPAPIESNVREQVFGLGTVGARVQSNVGFKVAGVLIA